MTDMRMDTKSLEIESILVGRHDDTKYSKSSIKLHSILVLKLRIVRCTRCCLLGFCFFGESRPDP